MPKFSLGQVAATPAAIRTLRAHNKSPWDYIERHHAGDWGDCDPEDRLLNDAALDPDEPSRIMSIYKLDEKDTIWIITEWDRSVTTVLLPEDY